MKLNGTIYTFFIRTNNTRTQGFKTPEHGKNITKLSNPKYPSFGS